MAQGLCRARVLRGESRGRAGLGFLPVGIGASLTLFALGFPCRS